MRTLPAAQGFRSPESVVELQIDLAVSDDRPEPVASRIYEVNLAFGLDGEPSAVSAYSVYGRRPHHLARV
ncbi:hypothetical protein [Mycobacterium sp.]|uniref:hypothetical protein n=1 Tax=Mycobacterium sp. TaxID=1785 RepID=UPI003A878E14